MYVFMSCMVGMPFRDALIPGEPQIECNSSYRARAAAHSKELLTVRSDLSVRRLCYEYQNHNILELFHLYPSPYFPPRKKELYIDEAWFFCRFIADKSAAKW